MKRVVFLFIAFLFVACASSEPPVVVTPKPAAPAVVTPPEVRPTIELRAGSIVSVSCLYVGEDWLFINGVEFRNAEGDTCRAMFKEVRRRVVSSDIVSESGLFAFAYGDEFLAWCGDYVEARPLCDNKVFDFKPLRITRE